MTWYKVNVTTFTVAHFTYVHSVHTYNINNAFIHRSKCKTSTEKIRAKREKTTFSKQISFKCFLNTTIEGASLIDRGREIRAVGLLHWKQNHCWIYLFSADLFVKRLNKLYQCLACQAQRNLCIFTVICTVWLYMADNLICIKNLVGKLFQEYVLLELRGWGKFLLQ